MFNRIANAWITIYTCVVACRPIALVLMDRPGRNLSQNALLPAHTSLITSNLINDE